MIGLIRMPIEQDEAFDLVSNQWLVACTCHGDDQSWHCAYGRGGTVFEARGDAMDNLGDLLERIANED